ncbi:MarR family winged helix-turn-helix transcriptional regulator [Virgibacillus soli]|uniref:Winged helix DNA-binding protein n=1 Tax=Paracerasibacillus soli TaxID=480284 RepID=A0ABU5CTP8_9BACI|nr:winged helix DNA-binding protein [Virgibacillus soli]MDY0409744.1 winged helix DNA-binding protein [Virgibacillus soli]
MHADFNLIDLISERHVQLRKLTESLWNDHSNIYISNSEWFILAKVYQKEQTTISYVTRQLDISRQATHKFIKSLAEKGLVIIDSLKDNKKEKCIQLTELGQQYLEKNKSLKNEIEDKIKEEIGTEKLDTLKVILNSDWGMES